MKSDTVSNKNSINIWVFIFIAAGIGAFQLFLFSVGDEDIIDLAVSIVSMGTPGVLTLVSFVVYKNYSGTKVFGRSYFSLGLAFLMIVLAEVTYIVYDLILQEDPYPSIADVFFFSYYLFAIAHLYINIKFFRAEINTGSKIWLAVSSILIIGIYSIFSFDLLGGFNFDYYYGNIFVAGSAVTFAFSILGLRSFRGGHLENAWFVLVSGFVLLTVADISYYYLELFEGYDFLHPVNLLWYSGYMVVIYALYLHRKIV